MSFLPTEEQQLAIDGLRKFLDKEVEPQIIPYLEKGELIPTQKMKALHKSLMEFGLVVAPFAEEVGGLGLDWVTQLMLFEEVVYTSIDLAVPIVINIVGIDLLLAQASEAIKARYIPGLMSGDLMISVGISEPDIGSDVAGVKTRAVRDGDDYIINGEKTWISNGEYSDLLVCTARTGDGAGGLTHFLVDREEHGYEVREIPKMAMNSQSTAQIFLSDVRVPASNMIGGEGQGLKNTLVVFERARLHMAAWGYGIARRALAESVRYSQERIQHGKPIAGHQLIAEKLATMATEVDAARLLALRAAEMIDRGIRCDKECSMAKWYGTELAARAGRQAVQIHGGNGVTKEFIVERLAREGIIAPIPDGTTEIQKLIIARSLTGISAIA
jgi:alkylation response protein AidB-like acyl-CoA dehydrogenase